MAEQDRIRLEIVTPEREVFHAMVEEFTVPALIGSTGILYNHAPLITALNPGVLKYKKDGQVGYISVSRGFLEVCENEAEILVAGAELPEEIDHARAEAARDRAKNHLQQPSSEVDKKRAAFALARAEARIQVYLTQQKPK